MHIFQTIAASVLTVLLSWFFPHQVPSASPKIPIPSPSVTPVVSFFPTQSANPANDVQGFVYPNAQKVHYLGNVITFVSTDDPQQITAWYENKIKSMQMHNTAISKINSNNTILNVLQASSDQNKIKIEITKAEGDSNASVTITTH